MHKSVVVVVLAVSSFGCSKKDKDAPATGSATAVTEKPAEVPAPTPATPTPAAPPPAPVKLTKEQLNPTCAKLFPVEVAAKTHGATEVKEDTAKGPLAICQFLKNGEAVGSITIACNPDLDPTAIDRERGAMTKAVDLPAAIGRGGYRISNSVILIDDETPCRLMTSYMTLPEGPALEASLRALTAAINPGTLQ